MNNIVKDEHIDFVKKLYAGTLFNEYTFYNFSRFSIEYLLDRKFDSVFETDLLNLIENNIGINANELSEKIKTLPEAPINLTDEEEEECKDVINKVLSIDEIIKKALTSGFGKTAQVGEIRTRKDGTKWKKITNTGQKSDWKQIHDDKVPTEEEKGKEGQNKAYDEQKPLSGKELSEAAKTTSETALNNAIKESDDPKIREAAHKELERRNKEEKPEEEKKVEKDSNKKSPQDKFEKETGKEWVKEAIDNIPIKNANEYDLKNYSVKDMSLKDLKPTQEGEDRVNASSKYTAEQMNEFLEGKISAEDVRKEDFYPIIIDGETNEILDGNHRFSASEMNNYDKIKCIVVNKKKTKDEK